MPFFCLDLIFFKWKISDENSLNAPVAAAKLCRVRLQAQCYALSFIMSPHPNDFNHFFVIMNLIDYPVLYIYSPGKGPG